MSPVIRVLQFLEENADFETREGVRQLVHGLGEGFHAEAITFRGGGLASAAQAIRQLRGRRGQFDLVHAWGNEALRAASLGWSGPILYSPPPLPTDRMLRWLRAAMAYRGVHVVCATTFQHRRCLQRGISPEACGLIRPGVDFGRLRRRRDEDLRRRLRLEPDDFTLLLAGESTAAASHLEGLWAAGILHVMDWRYKVIVWGRGPLGERLKRQGRRMGAPKALRFATEELGTGCDFDQLLPAADLVLAPARGPVHTLPIAWCMGAGLPIVATASPVVSELLEDHHTALMTREPTPRQIARRILELRDEPSLQWSIADRARAEAYDYFSQSRFLDEYRQSYLRLLNRGEAPQASNQPVHVV